MPNFKISADRATSSTINVYIRGVGQSDRSWGNEPGVGVYIDDVYLARPQTALLDVIDVQDLEILRGPQGTLYGKNTIAGAIKYVTRDIDGPATLTASATGGNYGEHDEKLYFSTPVIDDHVYFGIALADLQHDGYGQVVAQPGVVPPSPYVGQDVSNKDVQSGRVNADDQVGRELQAQAHRGRYARQFERLGRAAVERLPGAPVEQSVRHVYRHAGQPGFFPPQWRIGDLYPELDRPARS